MVNVNKNIKPSVKAKHAAPKRRPRNQALNSSKKLSGQGKLAELRKQKLNCSTGRLPAEYVPYYKVVSEQEFADTVGTDVDTLREIVAEIEVEYGENVVGYIIAKDEYGDAFVEANIESGFITESGRVLNGSNEGYIDSSEMKNAAQVNAGLNSSRTAKKTRMNCSSIDSHILDPIYDTLYNSATAEEYANYFEVPVEDVNELAPVVRDNGYGDVVGYLIAKPEYSDALRFNAIDGAMVLEDGTVGIVVRDRFHDIVTDIEMLIENGRLPKNLDSSLKPAQRTRMNCSRWDWDAWDEYGTPADVTPSIQTAVDGYGEGLVVDKVLTPTGGIGKYLNKQGITQLIFIYDGEDRDSYEEIVGWDGTKIIDDFTPYNLADIRDRAVESGFAVNSNKKTRMNCSADTKITTESGNEISMSEIKVVQNPSTNELALFIPENDEDIIPEGFTVIGDVVSAGGEEAENSEESEELDSSKKLNSSKRRSSKNLNSNIRRSAKKRSK